MQTVWQIAAGDTGRYYSDLFLDHDVMFMGPGDPGKFSEDNYSRLVEANKITSAKLGQLRTFCTIASAGDVVLLREGHRVTCIGLVPDNAEYSWNKAFDDVYGWDLQHIRRVIWQHQLSDELSAIQDVNADLFGERKQIPTITAVKDEKVLNPIRHLLDKMETRELGSLPQHIPEPLSLEQVGEQLYTKGLPNDSVDRVVMFISRLRRLAKWYSDYGLEVGRPTEHEVVAHMTLPLLIALGWSEQLLAIEWNKIDLAVFTITPTTSENCIMICEAKGLWHGLQNVLEQAVQYSIKHSLNKAEKIIVTDGMRVYLYERDSKGSWTTTPSGYINTLRIRTDHIAPRNTNAIDALMALTPAGVVRPVNR